MRTLFVLFLLVIGAKYFIGRYVTIDQARGLMDVVAQLDLFRALFYAVMPAAALVVFAPRLRLAEGAGTRRWLSFALCVILAWAVGRLPYYTAASFWPEAAENNSSSLASWYVFANVLALLWFHVCAGSKGRPLALGYRFFPVMDVLLPALVWSAGRSRHGAWFIPLRVLPAAMVSAVVFVPWLVKPQLLDDIDIMQDRFEQPAMRRLVMPPCYQVKVNPSDRTLLMTTSDFLVFRVRADDGRELARLDTDYQDLQSLAYDPDADQYIYVDLGRGDTLRLNSETLEVEQTTKIANPMPELLGNKMMTLASDDVSVLASFCQLGLARLTSEGDRILAMHFYPGILSDAVYDPQRHSFHIVEWQPGTLSELDADTLQVRRRLLIPNHTERIALDAERDRLFISLPLQGRMLIVDLKTYEPISDPEVFPGIRYFKIDYSGRRLLITGFSPLLEVRDLDDLSLIDRLPSAPWVRWMDVDEQAQKAYISTSIYGMYELDLTRLGDDSPGACLRRHDPFYAMLNYASRLMQRFLDWG